MAIKEKKTKKILGPIIPKKAKLKKGNKEIVLKNVGGKKPKIMEDIQDIEETINEILGPVVPKKAKLKKGNKEIVSKNVGGKKPKIIEDIQENEETDELKLKIKKNKKPNKDEREALQINDIIEETDETKNKKQKKSKKNKMKSTEGSDESKEEIYENVDSDTTTKNPKKQKKRKLSETDILDSDDESTPEVPHKRKKKKKEDEKVPEDPEVKARTVFIGNVPIKCTKKAIKKCFRKYGVIESIRVRGLPAANPKLSKKVVAIKQEFHPDRNNFICYVRYKNREDALKAEAENGTLFEGHHLRVHCCEASGKPDESKAIFIGNLSFDATEDELWKLFEDCGPISHVRIIRDTYSGMGKGFAFVNFKDSDAVQLALEMEDVKLRNRELRITLCNSSVAKKNNKTNKRKEITKPGQPRFRKPFKRNRNEGDPEGHQNFEGNKKGGFVPKGKNEGKRPFQGSKFTDKKKKFKKDKGLAEKKKKIKMIAPKTE